jgi:hypothetical protein
MPLYTGAPRIDRVPYLRYDAMGPLASQFSDAQDTDIPFHGLCDLEDIWTGHGLFERGLPPLWVWDPAIDKPAPKPDGKGFKRGFSLRVFFPGGRGVRELTSVNQGLFAAIAKIYDGEFEFAPERQQGLVPLLEAVDFTRSESPFGTITDPVFAIFSWEQRPPELRPRGSPPASPPPANSTKPPSALSDARADRDLDDEIPF